MRDHKKRLQKDVQYLSCPRCKSESLIIVDKGILECGHAQHVILCEECHQPFVIAVDPEEEFLISGNQPAFCLN